MTSTPESGSRTAVQPGSGDADLLASDADRDSVAGLLTEAFAEGRLTAAEHAQRAQAAYAARTCAELARLTADLPSTARPAETGDQRAAGSLLVAIGRCLLLCLCPPAGIAWLLSRRGLLGDRAALPALPGADSAHAEDR